MIVQSLPSLWKKPEPVKSYTVPSFPKHNQIWDYKTNKWVDMDKVEGPNKDLEKMSIGYQNITKKIVDLNRLIATAVTQINYNEGDIVEPYYKENKEKYGQLKVIRIARSITEMDVTMPLDHNKGDCPYCVYVEVLKDNTFLRCAPNYVTKVQQS